MQSERNQAGGVIKTPADTRMNYFKKTPHMKEKYGMGVWGAWVEKMQNKLTCTLRTSSLLILTTSNAAASNRTRGFRSGIWEHSYQGEKTKNAAATGKHFSPLSQRERERGCLLARGLINGCSKILWHHTLRQRIKSREESDPWNAAFFFFRCCVFLCEIKLIPIKFLCNFCVPNRPYCVVQRKPWASKAIKRLLCGPEKKKEERDSLSISVYQQS